MLFVSHSAIGFYLSIPFLLNHLFRMTCNPSCLCGYIQNYFFNIYIKMCWFQSFRILSTSFKYTPGIYWPWQEAVTITQLLPIILTIILTITIEVHWLETAEAKQYRSGARRNFMTKTLSTGLFVNNVPILKLTTMLFCIT